MASQGAKFSVSPSKGAFVAGKMELCFFVLLWITSGLLELFFRPVKAGQGFADRRKKKVMYEYRKLLNKERKKKGGTTTTGSAGSAGEEEGYSEQKGDGNTQGKGQEQKRFKKKPTVTAFSKQQQEFKKKQAEKEQRIKEAEQRKEDRIKAAAKHNKERWKRHVQLGKVNKKGQPVMANRIEFLLNKIQKEASSS
ncbi:thyroid transcription factor 1-associated protein 26 homolog [Branchiostoma floridae]|uniref:Thyroid transcription factor 1-associated protein 26 homolog n=1 Tax=Branchiostoma floridae TaxID=7739 RepID=A0A9J7MM14_BRAFL|nr:thyroid transcription factor 1-associated protein 26 homolog [Branchiostoma floridae]